MVVRFILYNRLWESLHLFFALSERLKLIGIPVSPVGHEPEEPNSADLLSVRLWAGRVQQNCSDTAPVPGTAWSQ